MTASDPAPTPRAAGRPHYAWVVAGVTFPTLLAAASIALAAGTVRDAIGDYRPAFLLSGALCAVAATLALRVRGARGRAVGPAAVPLQQTSS